MRSTSRWIITGLALSVSAGAQASVPDVTGTWSPFVPSSVLQASPTQYRTPETRAREQEDAIGLSYSERRQVQSDLKTLGFKPGPIDGAFGRLTRRAIWDWQYSMDHWASGYLTRDQVRQLRAAARKKAPERYSEAEDRRFWEETGAAWGSRDGMRRYLERYPSGVYAGYARERLGLRDNEEQSREKVAWQQAKERDTPRAYRNYLEQYPNGRHADSARERLREFQARNEHRDWDEARRIDTVLSYRAYLREYPNGVYAERAQRRMRELRDYDNSEPSPNPGPNPISRPLDVTAFDEARKLDTIAAYRAFLRDYPNSRLVPDARRRIEQLKRNKPKPGPKPKPVPTIAELEAQEQSIVKTEVDMRKLIEGLRSLGYLKVQTGLRMTPEVRDAIRRLQRKIKKPQTGYVDPHVWSVIATASVNR